MSRPRSTSRPCHPNDSIAGRGSASGTRCGSRSSWDSKVEEIRQDYARMRLAYRPEFRQPAGVIHGGVIASMIDTVVVPAVGSGYDEPRRCSRSTCSCATSRRSSRRTRSRKAGSCSAVARSSSAKPRSRSRVGHPRRDRHARLQGLFEARGVLTRYGRVRRTPRLRSRAACPRPRCCGWPPEAAAGERGGRRRAAATRSASPRRRSARRPRCRRGRRRSASCRCGGSQPSAM